MSGYFIRRCATIVLLLLSAACSRSAVHSGAPLSGMTAETVLPALPFSIKQECAAVLQNDMLWVHVHADETTALEAVRAHIRGQGRGCFITLAHVHGRAVQWPLGGQVYAIDTNRMFTENGRRRLLARQGCYQAEVATTIGGALAPLITDYLQQRRLLVAVHNNAAGGFGVGSYTAGGSLAADAAAVAVEQPQHPDDFFYVTHRRAFDFFRARSYNVVLQHPRVTDNGSLSVWTAQAGIP